jgi:hypothetical protein
MNMAIDITGFQRMRRQQAEKAKKEAEAKCPKQNPQSQLEKKLLHIEDADEYFSGRLHAESWGQADDDQRKSPPASNKSNRPAASTGAKD